MFSPPSVKGAPSQSSSYISVQTIKQQQKKKKERKIDIEYLHFTMAFKHVTLKI